MQHPYHKTIQFLSPMGILIRFASTPGGYFPLHWHEELEILYPLNGEINLWVEGKKHLIPEKNMAVIESCQVHSTYSANKASMFLNIHLSKKLLKNYLSETEFHVIDCFADEIRDDNFPKYRKICEFAENLTRLYIMDKPVYILEAEGIVLQLLAHLFRDFSKGMIEISSPADKMTLERIRSIITYTEEHFQEPITLGDAAGHLGLGKESFCRFVRKNMGMSFLNYLNEVRLSHVYRDLLNSDASIGEIMEKNGFTNQKLFNRTFKTLYGQTPSSVRRLRKNPEKRI